MTTTPECITPPASPGTPIRFDSITPLPDGSSRLQFKTGDSFIWSLQTSTNLFQWDGTYIKFLSNGWYEIRDFPNELSPHRFYRLKAEL
jgi:hypothetical protein